MAPVDHQCTAGRWHCLRRWPRTTAPRYRWWPAESGRETSERRNCPIKFPRLRLQEPKIDAHTDPFVSPKASRALTATTISWVGNTYLPITYRAKNEAVHLSYAPAGRGEECKLLQFRKLKFTKTAVNVG